MNRTDTSTLAAPAGDLLDALAHEELEVATRAIDRLAGAHDGSHYLLVPQVVVTARDTRDVAGVFRAAHASARTLTFRSGGTSLSGQAVSDAILVDTKRHFRSISVLEEGSLVRCEPGATVRAVNTRLLRHGRKLGPDPASEIACTIGGVVANNSSGMCCGTHSNTYRTLHSSVFVLPGGTIVDTSAPDADERLRRAEPRVHAGILRLRDRIRDNAESLAAIDALYSIKNTMGYGLNSFVDHDDAVDILERLMVGSEGTLAFVSEATFRTVPLATHLATGLLIFSTLGEATAALPALVEAGFAAIELLDSTSLRVGQRDPEATPELRELTVDHHAALLVEFQEVDEAALTGRLREAAPLLSELPLTAPAVLTTDAVVRAKLWHIRKGLFTAVAGNRPSGTTALLEDIAVPHTRLLALCSQLTDLFDEFGYEDSVIFGHAKDGNIHFLLNERFDDPASLIRYEQFTEAMVTMVLGEGGTLKAEHGTGRIMAPFVRRQYGDELFAVMREIKALIDPHGILNPGVLIADDPRAHLRNLKNVPSVEAEVDKCVECGYCEPVCPSRDITLTPRERIVVRREIARAESAGDSELVRQLRDDYRYDGVQTCAVDGMCQTACPVLINTGDLVRRLRSEEQTKAMRVGGVLAAKKWKTVTRAGGIALTVADALPSTLPSVATTLARAVMSKDVVPGYSPDLPGGGRPRPMISEENPAAVYFSSCTNTMFGAARPDSAGTALAFRSLCRKAGIALVSPMGMPSLCCGTPWKSKGLDDGYAVMRSLVVDALMQATRNGALPVVCDASSCSEGLELLVAAASEVDIEIVDAISFVDTRVLPLLPEGRKVDSLTVHPTCSSTRMGLDPALMRIADAASRSVNVPADWGCCAFAGDRGMLHPELTASATAAEASNVAEVTSSRYASTNRTCELGMTRATGRPYQHILEVLDDTVIEAVIG